ncbi:hypothetical protein VDGD_09353 [Verticillium dahliae]|nr:Transcriptional regulatory protein UME6 [Verticillium dahliae VDG1]RBQ97145.1 hypothetical protein VDGD_09353 [Verticillium dahliae]
MEEPNPLEPQDPDTLFPGDERKPWVRPEVQRHECNAGNRIDRAVERIRATPRKRYISDDSVFSQICDKEQGVMSMSAYMAAGALIDLVPGKEYDVFWTKTGGYERSIRLRFWQTLVLEDQRAGGKHVLRLAKHIDQEAGCARPEVQFPFLYSFTGLVQQGYFMSFCFCQGYVYVRL